MANRPLGWNAKTPVQIPRTSVPNRARVILNLEQVDNLIQQQGVRVRVYRTLFCPNVKSIDGAEHNISCPICKGSGFLDTRPTLTYAVLQNQALEKNLQDSGFVDGNSSAATFMNGITLQYFTLIEIIDQTDIFFERVKRQQGPVDLLKYRAKKINVVVDQTGKEYFEGNDFNLDPNGSIQWLSGRAPGQGTIYSVHYEFTLSYRAVQAMHSNRFVQTIDETKTSIVFAKGPEQWLIQKVYLVERKDQNGDLLPPNIIRDRGE